MSKQDYHPDWETGKWKTNCGSAERFHILYVEAGSIDDYGSGGYKIKLDSDKDYMMGPPGGSEIGACDTPAAALIKMGSVGVYIRDKVPENPLLEISDKILSGTTAAYGWSLDLDTTRIDGTELEEVRANIADCVLDGVTKGICPFWELKLTAKIYRQ